MEVTDALVDKLTKKATELRTLTVKNLQATGGGHFGGSLSMVEILTALYWGVMKVDPSNPKDPNRDYFILSKGHGCAGLGPILTERGFMDSELLSTFNQLGACFGMHTTLKMTGVEHPTGSLGHGLSVGLGIALALKLDKKPNRVFVMQGDGEINEGQPWEAMMAGNKFKLDNLVTIIDRNGLSMDGPTEEIMPLEPLEDKFRSFGWATKTVDGHDMRSLMEAFSQIPFEKGSPSAIIAKTVKGKGISFMEGKYNYHYAALSDDQYETAKREVGIG